MTIVQLEGTRDVGKPGKHCDLGELVRFLEAFDRLQAVGDIG